MCGISGIFKNAPINKRDIKIQKILLKEIKHRGPSSKGMSKAKNYITACSRLSIVDQRKVSNIPFETSKNILSYNGQLYNYKKLRKKLSSEKGISFKTKSDTEVFIKGYEIYGDKFFKMCEGMFAAAIYSKIKKNLILIVDPLSIKNLYFYVDTKNKLIQFSSESRSLNKLNKLGVNLSLSKEWFMNNQINHNFSFFNKIERVKGGTLIKFDKNLKKIQIKYFDLKSTFKEKRNKLKKFSIAELINIKDYISSDEKKLAVLLSGGVDSALISQMLLQKKKEQNLILNSYSADIKFKNISEKISIKKNLKKFKFTKSKFINVTKKNFLNDLFYISKNSSLPLCNPNVIIFYKLMKEIKKDKIKIAFTGDGADEFFNGYKWSQKKILPNNILSVGTGLNDKIYKIFFLKNTLKDKKYAIKKKIFYKDLNKVKSLSKTRFFNQNIYLDRWLRCRDELGMLNGVEVRVPFCDTKVINFVNSISNRSSVIKNKNILRQNLHHSIIKNKKIGFTIPFFSWITKKEILKILKKTNFFKLNIFNLKNFEKLINNRKSLFKYRMLVWQIISFCVWEKQHRHI